MILARRGLPRLLTLLVLCLMALTASPVQAMDPSLVRVYGWVTDSGGDPIPEAHVTLWNIRGSFTVETDASGRYETEVPGWRSYQVYAYGDDPSTPGLDYVPAHRRVSVGETTVKPLRPLRLLPGASIMAEGYFPSLENLHPPAAITFTVTDQRGLLKEGAAVTKYGGDLLSNHILGLDDRTLVVPSNIPFQVQVDIHYPGGIEHIIHLPPETLLQGDLLRIDLREHILWADVDSVYGYIASARALAGEAEGAGFYVTYERNELSKAEDLVEDAGSALTQAALDEAFAHLRESYLMVISVEASIHSLYVNASQSVVFITPLLGFTAVAMAAILTDHRRRRLTTGLGLYGALLGLLYAVYPGYSTLQKSAFNPWAGTPWEALPLPLLVASSLLVVFLVVHGLPYAFRERTLVEGLRPMSALAAALSMAARNLRRRRLRTILTALFMLISVSAFMVLTSLSLERGFFVEARRGQAPSEGFLLRKHSTIETVPFKPITQGVLQELREWLGKRPETTIVAVKLENIPMAGSLGLLTSAAGRNFYIKGVLGVYPSLEVQVTGIDQILEEGRFLGDGNLEDILISGEAASRLEVGVNDTLTFQHEVYSYCRNFTVTGIFDGERLKGLKDLDGEPLVPYFLLEDPVTTQLLPCFGNDVVIVHGEAAQRLPGVVVSRVDVQTRRPGEAVALARMMVLRWPDFEAYASVAGGIRRLFIGKYYAAGGFASAVVPLVLVVLNVGSVMLGAMYERRREVATMSSLGMNPFHISTVFVAEALVMGVVAGSLGYVLGLTSYRFITLGVRQKVEAIWGILVLILSGVAAVLGSALPATKASIIATPSLLRRWRIEGRPKTARRPWLLNLPLRIRWEEIGDFFSFMGERLQRFHRLGGIANLKISGEGAATRLSFTYICYAEENVVTDNELFLVESLLPKYSIRPPEYAIRMATRTRQGTLTTQDEVNVRKTGGFIRRLILQYSTQQGPRRG